MNARGGFGVALAAASALGGLAPARATPAPTREEEVLALVRELQERDATWYESAHFERVPAVLGSAPAFEPRVSALCGNSHYGSFDDAAARVLARRLGAIYGLDLAPDVAQSFGAGRAVLDGFDAAAGIGFELRGRRVAEGDEARDEAPAETLDAFELRVLAGRGLRVHVDDARRLPRLEGSSFLGTLAYLAGVVAFLNEVTEGEDVELGGLLYECEARALPATFDARAARLLSVEPESKLPEGVREFRLEERGTIRLGFAGAAGLLAPRSAFGELESAAAARAWIGARRSGGSVLALELTSDPSGDPDSDAYWPDFVLRLEQEREGRVETVSAPARCVTLLLPATLDLARPFTLVLELDPGRHRLEGVRLGVSARPAR